jgi:hypothetical protein
LDPLRAAHRYLDAASGWSPPTIPTLAEWMSEGVCRCPDDCLVAPADPCPHGLASWWAVLLAERDAAIRDRRWDPTLLLPHPGRFDLASPGAAEAVEAHEAAIARNEPTYADPRTGLSVMTARTLWESGGCCSSGCRHCPWLISGGGPADRTGHTVAPLDR